MSMTVCLKVQKDKIIFLLRPPRIGALLHVPVSYATKKGHVGLGKTYKSSASVYRATQTHSRWDGV